MKTAWIKEESAPARAVMPWGARTPWPDGLDPVVRLADFRHFAVWAVIVLIVSFVAGAIKPAGAAGSAANVDAARIEGADQDPANWMTYGRTYSEQRFSPLSTITADNVGQLGLAWFADLETNRGQEATPLVIDGVMYISTAWSMVKAFGAPTLTGQHAAYIAWQLAAFAQGTRQNDINEQMRMPAKELTPDEMHMIADFLGVPDHR
jgi:glucose dehydrogenase